MKKQFTFVCISPSSQCLQGGLDKRFICAVLCVVLLQGL